MLVLNGLPRWCTLEPAWRDNRQSFSCVPCGCYRAKRRYDSSKAPVTWELEDVPGRKHILVGHTGNSVEDTEGCVLFGSKFDYKSGRVWISKSRIAYDEYVSELKDYETITVVIKGDTYER